MSKLHFLLVLGQSVFPIKQDLMTAGDVLKKHIPI